MSSFQAPRFLSFWSINGPLELPALQEQMAAMREASLDGVVFHPRRYPGVPPYLSAEYLRIVSELILTAKAMGLAFWIYDENGWPSGSADGRLFGERPGDIATRLDLFPGPGKAGEAVCSFVRDGLAWHLAPQRVHGIDCLQPGAAYRFLEDIHERYRQGLSGEAFDHVEAFFADEPESGASWEPVPQYGGVPWSQGLPDRLEEAAGPGAGEKLPLLFFPGVGAGEFRVAYWELLADMISEGFFAPYKAWCEKWGKKFVAHVKGEEHPLFQIPMVGSCQRVYRHMSLPGIDALERYPSNVFFPRQAATVARQFGGGRAMAECFGGAGWGATPGDLERYLLWLGRNGITDFVLHLSQYRLDSAAIRDWPPSHPLHLTWRDAYPEVLRRVKDSLEQDGSPEADTLLIAPYRGIMEAYEAPELLRTNIHNAATYPDSPAGRINSAFLREVENLSGSDVSWHVIDERTFEDEGRMESGELRIGNCRYRRVLRGGGTVFRESGRQLWEQIENAGLSNRQIEKDGEAIPPVALADSRHSLVWKVGRPRINSFLLSLKPQGEGWFAGRFVASGIFEGGELQFADMPQEVLFNGRPLDVSEGRLHAGAAVPNGAIEAENQILVRYRSEVENPYAWMTGDFRVRSVAPFTGGPHGTVCTPGLFTLDRSEEINGTDRFVEEGYPFCFSPVFASTTIVLDCQASMWQFEGMAGDALRASIDGIDCGWAWGPEWKLQFPRPLPAGEHVVKIEVFPSTYNTYGPHHYYRGDAPVISPDQFAGKRNFADPDDAPECTEVAAWHFRPLLLPTALLSF